jgi:nitroreductase
MPLNDPSTPLSLLETRRSGLARELAAPGPSATELERILAIAARTPDHGKLNPWRFIVIAPDQREAFAALLLDALQQEDPQAPPLKRSKTEVFARQGAALVVLVCSPTRNHKVPVWEQQLSCGAAGMNLLHAAHALGYVGTWLTGWYAYSPRVRQAFCADGEDIAGFFFLGTPQVAVEERPRPNLGAIAGQWDPDQSR